MAHACGLSMPTRVGQVCVITLLHTRPVIPLTAILSPERLTSSSKMATVPDLEVLWDDRNVCVTCTNRSRLSPYMSTLPTKLQDLRTSPSLTKSSIERELDHDAHDPFASTQHGEAARRRINGLALFFLEGAFRSLPNHVGKCSWNHRLLRTATTGGPRGAWEDEVRFKNWSCRVRKIPTRA